MGTKSRRWWYRLQRRGHDRDTESSAAANSPKPSESSPSTLSPIEKAQITLARVTHDFETNYTDFLQQNSAIKPVDVQLRSIIESADRQRSISLASQNFQDMINAMLEVKDQREEASKGKVATTLNCLYTLTRVCLRVTSTAAKVYTCTS